MPSNTKLAPTVLPAVFFIASGAGKVTGQQKSLEIRELLRVPKPAWRAIGITEVVCGSGTLLGLADRRIGLASKSILGVLCVAAIAAHGTKRDSMALVIPSAVMLVALAISESPLVSTDSVATAPADS